MDSKEAIQKYCEQLEELIEIECKTHRLKPKEFHALNMLLFELQANGLYKYIETETNI